MKRRTRFTSPLDAWSLALRSAVARPFKWFRPTTRFVVGFAALTLATTFLLAKNHSTMPGEVYKVGDVVRTNVISPADIDTEDVRETERRRVAAASAAPTVWSYDPTRGEAAARAFRNSWETLKPQLRQQPSPQARGNANADGADDLESVARIIRETGEGYVFDDRDARHLTPEIRLVDARGGAQSALNTSRNPPLPLSAALHELRDRLAQLPGWTPSEREALRAAVEPTLAPTLVFNEPATDAARSAAANSITPAVVTLRRNEIVARAGDTITPQMLAEFAAVRSYGATERRPHHFIGLFLIVAALYAAAWRFVEYRSTITTLPISKARAFTLVGSAILVELVIMRVGFIVAESIASQSYLPPLNDPSVWAFAIPFAAAALLLALLVDTQLALIAATLTAVFAGLLAPNGMLMSCYALISSSAAIYGIGRYRERQSVTLAGVFVGAVNALVALAVMLSAQQPFTLNSALLALACGLAGGLLTTIFTSGGLPVNESMFGILTDVKLLELSNADLPVLGQLALRAPGTNQHSHAVGQLAEEACRSIGANSLLARIGALYHDIGKTAAPEMFVENQTACDNPHDRLRPTQSARIITSHVTYGLKLAKEIGLPKQIADFIPQHHGTRTLHFFLRKAQAHAARDETIDETEFRYPGPKPQFKEAAIMMLADSCEAAARSLSRPDPENISAIVGKIFDAIVSDGQLDECDLSLRELTKVRESIIISLTAIYHARIDYPGFNPPSLNPSLVPLPSAELDSEERGVSYTRASEVPISKGGEVEDEAVTRK